jgi:hypothetical protein
VGLVLVTAPTIEPVTLADAKLHLRVDNSAEDSLLNSLIVAARTYVESFTNRALLQQTWAYAMDDFNNIPLRRPGMQLTHGDAYYPPIHLPRSPVQSVTSVTYIDTTGTRVTLAPSQYLLDTSNPFDGNVSPAFGISWPQTRIQPGSVVITYVAGFADVSSIPATFIQAMKLLLTHWYENRGAFVESRFAPEVPFSVDTLLWIERAKEFA